MKTILITGATDGVGKGLALHYLQQNFEVYAVGTSHEKAALLKQQAKAFGKEANLHVLQANLSLVSENKRVVEWVKEHVTALDGAVFCAASLKPQESYRETEEGLEFTFALYYVSRFVLSYALKDVLEASTAPFILNVAAPGMKGEVKWEDLQWKSSYNGQSVQFHGSRLNDLLAVQFTQADTMNKIRYLLFNPMAVRTPGAAKMFEGTGFSKKLGRLYYKLLGKDIEEIVEMIVMHEQQTLDAGLHAFKQTKSVALSMPTFDVENAKKLDEATHALVASIKQ